MPMGGEFRDQFSLIFHLSEKLDCKTFLLVKEHPSTFISKNRGDRGRWTGFYKKISELNNVKLVSINLDNKLLIRNSVSVVTISGTVALEAASFGKLVSIYGRPWYKRLFRKITDFSNCTTQYNFDPGRKLMIFDLSLKEGARHSLKFVSNFLKQ